MEGGGGGGGGFFKTPPPPRLAIPLPYLKKNRCYMYVPVFNGLQDQFCFHLKYTIYWVENEKHKFTQNDTVTSEIDWWFVCLFVGIVGRWPTPLMITRPLGCAAPAPRSCTPGPWMPPASRYPKVFQPAIIVNSRKFKSPPPPQQTLM